MTVSTIALLMFFSGIALRVFHHLYIRFNGENKARETAPSRPAKKMKFSFLGSLLIAGTVLYAVEPAYLEPFSLGLPAAVRWAGIGLMILAGAVIIWIQMMFGKGYNGAPNTRTEQRILTTGPFRYVRHPMYAVTIVFIAGYSLALDNYLIALLGVVSYFIPVLIIARREEKMLTENYGAEYVAYMERTGRFFPKL